MIICEMTATVCCGGVTQPCHSAVQSFDAHAWTSGHVSRAPAVIDTSAAKAQSSDISFFTLMPEASWNCSMSACVSVWTARLRARPGLGTLDRELERSNSLHTNFTDKYRGLQRCTRLEASSRCADVSRVYLTRTVAPESLLPHFYCTILIVWLTVTAVVLRTLLDQR